MIEDSKYWIERQRDCEPDGRLAYERDFARLVHSASFRRLQAKTQVLGLGDSDFYRTRLTHSMEVSQIGEAIARLLIRGATKGTPSHGILPDPLLIRTVCLAHDLGHPPFGHGGEVALNRCMMDYGGFEGNGQTLRVMAKLEPYDKDYGMNLTRRTLLGVLKYPATYEEVVNTNSYPKESFPKNSVFKAEPFKPPKCYLGTEDGTVSWVFEGELANDWFKVHTDLKVTSEKHKKTKYKSLDTSIMELGDDIAYGVHDLEDALSLKLITRRQFERDLPEESFKAYIESSDSLTYQRIVDDLFSDDTIQRKSRIGSLVGYFVSSVILETGIGDFEHPIFSFNAVLTDGPNKVLKALKNFVYDDVIKSTPVQQLEFKGQKIVTELFNVFMTDPERLLMARDFKKTVDGDGDVPTARVICDYIAGMTDEYATKRYQQLFEPRVGSVFDRL